MTKTMFAVLTSVVAGCIALTCVVVVMGMLVGETWCEDRSPWWGPPQDPASSCSGLAWAQKHPGEYPWTMPR